MNGGTKRGLADLVLRIHEDGPFWRWAWLNDGLEVVTEGAAFSRGGAEKVAATVLAILVKLGHNEGFSTDMSSFGVTQTAPLPRRPAIVAPPGWEMDSVPAWSGVVEQHP